MFKHLHALLQPPADMSLDFRYPPMAPALVPADGIPWEIFSTPVTLFIGGIAAVLLELAEPSVRTGVWAHSSFRHDPLQRLHRTGYAALATVYARQLIARVVRMHERVRGHPPEGVPYHANDTPLLNWVHAPAIFGFTEAFPQYVRSLCPAEKSAALPHSPRIPAHHAQHSSAVPLGAASATPADSDRH